MYNVGQADSLLGPGSVSMPKYDNCSLSRDQYPCNYAPVDLSKKPEQLPLGLVGNYPGHVENYEENTQHKQAGELEDKHLFIIVLVMLILGAILFALNMKYI